MDLSVIIVNYNVKHYLEQSIQSALEAMKNIEAELIVVDNNSTDGSVEMLDNYKSEIQVIASKENLGFSKGNNLAIKRSKGRYILLLNPDTIVPEDCFKKCISFADEHPDCGGLGVKMLDGKGEFLPESKRGIPLPKVAFYKITGLSKLFPSNPKYNQYHLGYLDDNEIDKADILSGAFMFMRKETLDKTGLLDETFFMYGEDIDLSYRILKAGYSNYYFPETHIIHYKGESTKKSSVNYVLVFYKAMAIFYKKHFSKKKINLISLSIYIAIWLRATLALFRRLLIRFFLPVSEALLLFGTFVLLKELYAENFRFPLGGSFQEWVVHLFFPATIAIILLISFIGGSYEKPFRIKKTINSTIVGFIAVLIIYALLPESFRFSRLLILLNAFIGIAIIALWRLLLSFLKLFPLQWNKNEKTAIVAEKDDAKTILKKLSRQMSDAAKFYYISPKEESKDVEDKDFFVGSFNQLNDIIDIYYIKKVVLSKASLTYKSIIQQIGKKDKVDYYTCPEGNKAIIGSEDLFTGNLFYNRNKKQLFSKSKARQKRLLDYTLSFLLIISYPIHFLFVQERRNYFKNLSSVLSGKKTFVGIYYSKADVIFNKGLLSVSKQIRVFELSKNQIEALNFDYITNYTIAKDLIIIFKNFKQLGE